MRGLYRFVAYDKVNLDEGSIIACSWRCAKVAADGQNLKLGDCVDESHDSLDTCEGCDE